MLGEVVDVLDDGAFRRVFVASQTPMAVARAEDLRFVDANEAYQRLVGYSAEELRNKTPVELTHPEDRERELDLFREVLTSERNHYGLEKRFLHREGGVVWASVTVTVLTNDEGEPEYGVAICEDITERKHAQDERARFERELLEAQKLESLGLLAGGIAHDFNNLLVGILGNTELAREMATDAPTRELLDDALQSARVAADLCRQMLAYSGGGAIEKRAVDLADVVASSLRLLDVAKRGALRFTAPEDRPAVVADVVQLRQLVLNLATNAVEALPGKGEVRVRVTSCDAPLPEGFLEVVGGEVTGDCACLVVEDEGVGMTEENLARAFEPFRSTKGAGRGLGLAAVAGIVRAHGGVLGVRSAPDAGTTFHVKLPRTDAPPHPVDVPPRERQSKPGPLRRILLVDDDEMVRRVVSRILASEGHELVSHATVSDARAALAAAPFDLVVTDLTMPDGSGLEVAADAHRRGLRTLVLTGYGELRATEEELSVVAGFLRKPFKPSELVDAVAAAIA